MQRLLFLFVGILLVLMACYSEAEKPKIVAVSTYANEYGEIQLTRLDEQRYKLVFSDNEKVKLDTILHLKPINFRQALISIGKLGLFDL